MADIREAYDILSKNELLCHVFDFTEIDIPEFLDSGRKSWTLNFAEKWRKNEEKKYCKKYLIVCAFTETEDHINSFQVKVDSPCHLTTSENLWFFIFLGG